MTRHEHHHHLKTRIFESHSEPPAHFSPCSRFTQQSHDVFLFGSFGRPRKSRL
jgi:hypothetical protein